MGIKTDYDRGSTLIDRSNLRAYKIAEGRREDILSKIWLRVCAAVVGGLLIVLSSYCLFKGSPNIGAILYVIAMLVVALPDNIAFVKKSIVNRKFVFASKEGICFIISLLLPVAYLVTHFIWLRGDRQF